MIAILRVLVSAATCDRLGHEWERVGCSFVCRWCGESGYDASESRIDALRERWSK